MLQSCRRRCLEEAYVLAEDQNAWISSFGFFNKHIHIIQTLTLEPHIDRSIHWQWPWVILLEQGTFVSVFCCFHPHWLILHWNWILRHLPQSNPFFSFFPLRCWGFSEGYTYSIFYFFSFFLQPFIRMYALLLNNFTKVCCM